MTSWHIIECTRGRESACALVLERLGYPGAWYPQKTVSVPPRRTARRSGIKEKRVQRAWVNGYLFVPADEVSCYHVNGWHGQLWFRVLAPGGEAYRVKDEDMARMRDVPKRIAETIQEAKRLEQEAKEAVRRIGAKVKIIDGPFEGQVGTVDEARTDGVRVSIPDLWKVVVSEDYLQLIAD